MPGPIPNHSSDLSRASNANRANRPPLVKGIAKKVDIPDPDLNWHKVAKMVWDSLEQSGQSDFYQQSDWAVAYMMCDTISEYRKATRRSAQMLQSIQTMMTNLMLTEGDRRRLRIELGEEPREEESPGLAAVASLQEALGARSAAS